MRHILLPMASTGLLSQEGRGPLKVSMYQVVCLRKYAATSAMSCPVKIWGSRSLVRKQMVIPTRLVHPEPTEYQLMLLGTGQTTQLPISRVAPHLQAPIEIHSVGFDRPFQVTAAGSWKTALALQYHVALTSRRSTEPCPRLDLSPMGRQSRSRATQVSN